VKHRKVSDLSLKQIEKKFLKFLNLQAYELIAELKEIKIIN
jgi:hypothetical protein